MNFAIKNVWKFLFLNTLNIIPRFQNHNHWRHTLTINLVHWRQTIEFYSLKNLKGSRHSVRKHQWKLIYYVVDFEIERINHPPFITANFRTYWPKCSKKLGWFLIIAIGSPTLRDENFVKYMLFKKKYNLLEYQKCFLN